MGLFIGADGLARPRWAAADDLLSRYYDEEWGNPVKDEQGVFERLCLEVFLAGLSWATILRKRENFRAAFEGFDVDRVAAYGEPEIQRLLADPGIVRNRRKIEAVINNARATVALRAEGGLERLVWSFQTPPLNPTYEWEIPTSTPESEELSKRLKSLGFAFVGPTTICALMQAIGVSEAHLVGSHRNPVPPS